MNNKLDKYDIKKLKNVIEKIRGHQIDINDDDMEYIKLLIKDGFLYQEEPKRATSGQTTNTKAVTFRGLYKFTEEGLIVLEGFLYGKI